MTPSPDSRKKPQESPKNRRPMDKKRAKQPLDTRLETDMDQDAGLAARRCALEVYDRIFFKDQPFDQAFERTSGKLEPRDRAFARHLLFASLRRRAALQQLLKSLTEKPLSSAAKRVGLILEQGLAQLLLMDLPDHAVVDNAVKLTKSLSAQESRFSGLVNAILRRAAREKEALKQALNGDGLLELPPFIRRRWHAAWGEEKARQLGLALRETPPLDIIIKEADQLAHWAEKLTASPITIQNNFSILRRPACDVTALEGFETGAWWIQDLAASLPVQLLKVTKGHKTLDLCAAPGGKTMQLASLKAQVTALDRSAKRMERLEENLKRTGLKAQIEIGDALDFSPPEDKFDRVLLDAPCSANGTFRRNPDVLWLRGIKDIQKLANLQARLLDHAVSLLKPGGILLYCVCSLEKEEGEIQWQAFLKRSKDMAMLPITASETGPLHVFLDPKGWLRTYPGYSGFKTSDTLPILQSDIAQNSTEKPIADQKADQNQLLSQGLDGFFIARAQKKL